jgi:formate dehydrogenase maturation protein FdhE
MLAKVEQTKLSQKCVCGKLSSHLYSDLAIERNYIKLPACEDCGSLEILYNNNADDDHSIKVTKVFAKVATQG